jgi:molybdopterin-guanine dinucleotide biosynthesis protein B
MEEHPREAREGAQMPPILAVVGRSGTGKTEILCDVLSRLRAIGYRVDTVKHAPDHEEVDRAGADSARHQRAGAHRTLLVGASNAALFWSLDAEKDLAHVIDSTLDGADLILVEGGKHTPFPKIEVFRQAAAWPEGPLAGEIDVLAVITDDPVAVPDGTEVIPRRNLDRLLDLVEEIVALGR